MPEPIVQANKFEKSIVEWNKKAVKWQTSAEIKQANIRGLEARQRYFSTPSKPPQALTGTGSLRQRTGEALKAPTDITGTTFYKGERYRVWPEGTSGARFDTSSQLEAARISQEIKVAGYELYKDAFFTQLYGTLPALIERGAVDSPDEALALLGVPADLSEDKLAEVKQDIELLIGAYRESRPTSEEDIERLEAETKVLKGKKVSESVYGVDFPPLEPPSPAKQPDTIHRVTVEALIKSLTSEKIPESVWTTEQYNEFLSAQGWSQDDIDNQTQLTTERLIAETVNRKNLLEAYRSNLDKMPDWTTWDAVKQSMINPPLAVLEGLQLYFQHVSMPAAGWLYGAIPDIHAATQEYINLHPEGGRMADAYTYAWEKWDAPGPPVTDFALKYILMEGLVDPLTYIGWGIVTRGLRALGPAGRLLAAGNMAMGEVLELPFDFVKYVGRAIVPKTISQQAAQMSRTSLSILNRYFELATNKYMWQIKPAELAKAAEDALAHLAKNPRAEDDIALAARELLAHAPTTRKELEGWIERIRKTGAEVTEIDKLSDRTISEVDFLFEQVFNKELKALEAAPLFLQKIGASNVTKTVKKTNALVARILSEKGESIIRHALDPFAETSSHRAMRIVAKKTLKIYEDTIKSEVMAAAVKAGRFRVLAHNINKNHIQTWHRRITNLIIRPAAESYLTFGMYGPLNTFEDIFRSVLGGVKPGRLTVEQYQMFKQGLLGDPNIERQGVSETYGFLRDKGEPARSNWIVMLSTLWASAPTMLATRGKVTPKIFAQKTYEYMVEFFGGVSAEIRRNFVMGRATQLLADNGGDAYKALLKIVPKEVASELKDLPKWVKQNLLRDLRTAVTTGNLTPNNKEMIKLLKDRYTHNKILREEIKDIIMKYPDLSPTARSMVLDAFDEGMIFREVSDEAANDSIRAFARSLLDSEIDDFLRGPERAAVQMEQLTRALESLNVTSPADMADLIVSLHRMNSTLGLLPDQVMAMATVKSRGLPWDDRLTHFDAESDRIYEFIDKSGASVDRVINRLEQTLKGSEWVNNIDWSIVDFINIPDLPKRAEMRTWVDMLPFSMKQNIKHIEINYPMVSAGDRQGSKALAQWDYSTGTIIFRNMEEATSYSLFHEMAHSHFLQRIDDSDMSLLKEWAETYGDWRPPPQGKELTGWKTEDIISFNRGEGIQHYQRFRSVHENFSDDFEAWTRDGIIVAKPGRDTGTPLVIARKQKFFEKNFPKKQKEVDLSPEYKSAAQRYLDLVHTARKRISEAKDQDRIFRQDYFRGASKKDRRSADFWDSFYAAENAHWRSAKKDLAVINGQLHASVQDVNAASGVINPVRPAIKVIGEHISPADVARLMGVQGDDVSRMLLDTIIPEGDRDYFVEYVMQLVRPNYDEGFDRVTIGEVYDQIAASLQVDPSTSSWFRVRQMQVESLSKDLHTLYESKMMKPEEKAAVDKMIDDAAEASTGVFGREVPTVTEKDLGLAETVTKLDDITTVVKDEKLLNSMRARVTTLAEETPVPPELAGDLILSTAVPMSGMPTELVDFLYKHQSEAWARAVEQLGTTKVRTLGDVAVVWFDESTSLERGNASLQLWGEVAEQTPSYTKGIRAILWEQYPEGEFYLHRGGGSSTQAGKDPLARKYTNVTSSRRTAINFEDTWSDAPVNKLRKKVAKWTPNKEQQAEIDAYIAEQLEDFKVFFPDGATYTLKRDAKEAIYSKYFDVEAPSVDSVLVKIDDIVAIGAVEESELIIRSSVLRDRIANPLKPTTQIKGGMMTKAEYDKIRQESLDEAQRWYYKEYTDYSNDNMIDAVMKAIYPFWSYESQRWFWLPRSFVRHPGALTTWGRWQDNTDFGYVHLPGTSIDINPARGTVYGTWSTRMMRRDYPEYYDELEGFGGVIEAFDFISRYGFYPNVIFGAVIAERGGATGQLGGILPSIASTPLNWLIGAHPDNPLVEFISERVFPTQFRNYLTARRVDDLGGDGSLVFAKKEQGLALTDAEEAMWTAARKSVALHSASFEQLGFARMKSDKSYELMKASTAFIEQQYGYTEKEQKLMRRRGQKIWDQIGGLDPWETEVLKELEFFKYSGSINPVLPSHKQAILNRIETDWADVAAYSETMNLEITDLSIDFLTGSERGRLGPAEFLQKVKDLQGKRRDYIDKKTEANPLMLLENRTAFYEKYGDTMPVQSPYNELLDLYFSIELKETIDPVTEERITDWDSFMANRSMIDVAIPAEDKATWDAYLSRNTAPIMKLWYDVYNTYLKKYYGLYNGVLEQYTPEQQSLIKEYLSLKRLRVKEDRQAEIKEMTLGEAGDKLIANFSSIVASERKALRYANPYLDAWLYYWGRTSSLLSSQSNDIYNVLVKQTGRVIE